MAVLFWHTFERIQLQPVDGGVVIPQFVHHRRESASNRGKEVRVDSRPSDAIVLAMKKDVPIYVAEAVLESAAASMESDD